MLPLVVNGIPIPSLEGAVLGWFGPLSFKVVANAYH